MQYGRRNTLAVTSICVLLSLVLSPASLAIDHVHVDTGDGGMVVSESAVASRIGRDILLQGGNAVDAAVATAFTMAVSWPEAGNIGGGGFMVIRPANGKDPVCIDYREVAPMTMTETSFSKEDTTFAQKAVGVPGTVRGLALAHARYGKLPWKELVMPAARLAAQGVPVDVPLASSINRVFEKIGASTDPTFAEIRRVYGKQDGTRWQPGDRLVLPDLAKTLTRIAQQGADGFYQGPTAQLLVDEMRRGNGMISLDDLSQYKAILRPAMRGTFRGYTIIGAPPPSSGGTCIIEALNILENFDLASRDRYDPRNVHLIAEASRRVFADRARFLGDPQFTKIPAHLISKIYAKELADGINPNKATPSQQVAAEIKLAPESPDTTHLSVVDGAGMAVSNTYTLEASWGSRVVVRGAGFLLNNEMGDFNWFPGETNRGGRIGTSANIVQPGKRMLSSQSPTIVEKDGKVVLVTGSPGGRTIINTTLCVVLGFTEFGMNAAEAVAAPRMHHQWFPDRIDLERVSELPHVQIAVTLRAMGHQVGSRSAQGSAHSIQIDPDTGRLTGVSDHRRGGRPAAIATGTIARWDFADVAGVELPATRSTGSLQSKWSGGIADSQTDGRDHFRIRRDAPNDPMDAYLPLESEDADSSIMIVEVKIDAAAFRGGRKTEQLRIGFTNDKGKPEVTARMILGRDEEDAITIRGEALGGGTPIAKVILSPTSQLSQPIVLRLELDTQTDVYRISSRQASDVKFTPHGTGKIAKKRQANFVRLSALNDFSAEGEFVDIDRIELQRHPSK